MRIKRSAVVLVGATAFITSGVAMAAWTATGTGSGSAASISAVDLVVETATVTADLFPGKTGGALKFTVTNPNPYDVKVTSVNLGSAAASATGCTAPAITFQTPATQNQVVAKDNGTFTFSLPVVNMGDSSNDCQGKTFTVTGVTVGGASV